MKMGNSKEFVNKKEIIEKLRKAFSIPIVKGKLKSEIDKMKKSEMVDSELIKNLSELYLQHNLKNKIKQDDEENRSPRILYSEYLSD